LGWSCGGETECLTSLALEFDDLSGVFDDARRPLFLTEGHVRASLASHTAVDSASVRQITWGSHHESTVAPNWPDTLLPAALSVVVILRKKK